MNNAINTTTSYENNIKPSIMISNRLSSIYDQSNTKYKKFRGKSTGNNIPNYFNISPNHKHVFNNKIDLSSKLNNIMKLKRNINVDDKASIIKNNKQENGYNIIFKKKIELNEGNILYNSVNLDLRKYGLKTPDASKTQNLWKLNNSNNLNQNAFGQGVTPLINNFQVEMMNDNSVRETQNLDKIDKTIEHEDYEQRFLKDYENSHKKFLQNLKILRSLEDEIHVMHTFLMKDYQSKFITNTKNDFPLNYTQINSPNGDNFENGLHINQMNNYNTQENFQFSHGVNNSFMVFNSEKHKPYKYNESLNLKKFDYQDTNDNTCISREGLFNSMQFEKGKLINMPINYPKNDPNSINEDHEKIRESMLIELKKMLDDVLNQRKLNIKLSKVGIEQFMKKVIIFYKIIIKDLAMMQQSDLAMMLLILIKIIAIQFEDIYASYFIQIDLEKRSPDKKLLEEISFQKDRMAEQNLIFEKKEMRYEAEIRELKRQLENSSEDMMNLQRLIHEKNNNND